MNISIETNGFTEELITKNNFSSELSLQFDLIFEEYFKNKFKISVEEFEAMIKEKYPEKFI